jgi:hypothetical protein
MRNSSSLKTTEEFVADPNRGNWTAIELFIAGISSWDAELRRSMVDHS